MSYSGSGFCFPGGEPCRRATDERRLGRELRRPRCPYRPPQGPQSVSVLARAGLSPQQNDTVPQEGKRQAPRPVWGEDVVQKVLSHSSPDAHNSPPATLASPDLQRLGIPGARRHRMTIGFPSSREGSYAYRCLNRDAKCSWSRSLRLLAPVCP